MAQKRQWPGLRPAIAWQIDQQRLFGLHDLLRLVAEARDAQLHHVAGLEELRLRLHAERDAGRRAGDDDVAGLEHHELRAVPDEVHAVEDHRFGRAVLPRLAVDGEMHRQALRVLDLVLGDEPGAERAERLAALALGPLAGPLDLKNALGYVVGEAIAGDRVHRLLLGEIAGAGADHDAELDLVVELGRVPRDDRGVVRSADAGRRLVEDDRLLRNRHAGLGRVVRVVQPDGDEVADMADAGADARLALDDRQLAGGRRLLDLGEAPGRERVAGEIGHDLGEIADAPLSVQDSRFFAAGRAEAQQLHDDLLNGFGLVGPNGRPDHASDADAGQAGVRTPPGRCRRRSAGSGR